MANTDVRWVGVHTLRVQDQETSIRIFYIWFLRMVRNADLVTNYFSITWFTGHQHRRQGERPQPLDQQCRNLAQGCPLVRSDGGLHEGRFRGQLPGPALPHQSPVAPAAGVNVIKLFLSITGPVL